MDGMLGERMGCSWLTLSILHPSLLCFPPGIFQPRNFPLALIFLMELGWGWQQ